MKAVLGMVKELAKKIGRLILGEYSAYYVYSSQEKSDAPPGLALSSSRRIRPVDKNAVETSGEALIRDQAFYLGSEALAYASYLDDRIVGLCIYWYGERYRKRNFWPLQSSEAKLVQIVTVPGQRGGGIATELIAFSCMDVLAKGFDRTYARIWHSNTPSIRAFERAGWSRRALVLELNPLRRKQPIRLQFETKA